MLRLSKGFLWVLTVILFNVAYLMHIVKCIWYHTVKLEFVWLFTHCPNISLKNKILKKLSKPFAYRKNSSKE